MAAVDFQLEACPHCGADAEVREHTVYRYQCKACGSPRIPINRHWLTTPATVTRHLKQVRGHHIQRGLWSAASWALWGAAVLCALFGAGTAWSLDFGAAGWTFVTILTLLPLVLAVTTRVMSAKHRRQTVSRLEDAWREIAGHFFSNAALQTKSPAHGRTLADVKAAFRVDNDVALRLLAEGEVAAYLDHETSLTTGIEQNAEANRWRVVDQPGGPAFGPSDESEDASTSDLAEQQSRSK